MDKKSSLIISFLVTSLILLDVIFISNLNYSYKLEEVKINRVIDGDTIELSDGRTIRLLNINAPEKDLPESKYASEYLKTYENKSVKIDTTKPDKYGRTLARLYSSDYINLNLVKKGFAHAYLVTDKENKDFISAQKKAISLELGIWKKSEFYGCLSIRLDEINELLDLINKCPENLTRIRIKDEGTKSYTLTISGNSNWIVHSGKGISNEKEKYLNSENNIWNNDKDSIFVRDEKGFLVFYDSYGY